MIPFITSHRRTITNSTLVLLAIVGFFLMRAVRSADIGNLALYHGTTEIIRGDKGLLGKNGQGVRISDAIQVEDQSRSALILKDASRIRLDAGSRVEVAALQYNGQTIKQARFRLVAGRLWSNTRPLPLDGEYSVETPTIVAAVRGTRFDIHYQNGVTDLWVVSHRVAVSLKSTSSLVANIKAGQHLMVRDGFAAEDFLRQIRNENPPAEDNWVQFNQEEDANLGFDDDSVRTTPTSVGNIATTTIRIAPPTTSKSWVKTSSQTTTSTQVKYFIITPQNTAIPIPAPAPNTAQPEPTQMPTPTDTIAPKGTVAYPSDTTSPNTSTIPTTASPDTQTSSPATTSLLRTVTPVVIPPSYNDYYLK